MNAIAFNPAVCAACAVMLGDAVKTEGLEERLQVREISELVLERVA